MTHEIGEKKKRSRLNLLDWTIIAVVLLALVGISMRYGFAEKWAERDSAVDAIISFSVSDIKETSYTGGYFREGESVFNVDNDMSLIGTFAGEDKFSYVPAKYFVTSKTGETLIKQSVTDRIDVTGAICARGICRDDGFFYGGTTYIAPGQWVNIVTRGIKVQVLITDIEILDPAS